MYPLPKEVRFAFLIEPPFCYRTPDDEVTGCDVAVARYVLDAIGIETMIPVETEFAELLPGVADGRWQMTTGLFATKERQKHAQFSKPVWALPDGLLVKAENPRAIFGYRSIENSNDRTLGVIKDQAQHRTALKLGVPENLVRQFNTYSEAARSVLNGTVDAYASVGRAHQGFLDQNPDLALMVVDVPFEEKPPEFGAFAFALENDDLRRAVDDVLEEFLGSKEHREIMAKFRFSSGEVDLVAASRR